MKFESMVNSILIGLGVTLIWNGQFAEGCNYLLQRLNKQFDKGHDILAIIHDGLSMAYLHQGQYEQAKNHNELSLSAAYQSKIPRYIAKALWVKGQIALIQEDSETTQQVFRESLAVIEGIELVGSHELPLVGLAVNAFRCDDLHAMRKYLLRALQIIVDSENFLSLLDIFPAVALYLFGRGEKTLALKLYTLASQHGYVANSHGFEDVVGQPIKMIKVHEVIDTAVKEKCPGKGCEMWVSAVELLLKLELIDRSRLLRER